MDLIHAETDELRSTGRACDTAYLDLAESLSGIRTAAFRLEAGWQGGAADSFRSELAEWQRTMDEQVERIFWYARTLARTAEGWEEIDQRWTGAYRDRHRAVPEEAVRA